MTRFMEWLGRVVMLVLAGMITLSIIGSIASIPSGSIGTRITGEPQAWPEARPSERAPVPPDRTAGPSPEPSPPPQPGFQSAPTASPRPEMVAAPAAAPPATAAQWLESIAYAMLAVAGLLALGILLLFRALHHWRRSADALEALAYRKP